MSQWTHVCGCIRYNSMRMGRYLDTQSGIRRLIERKVPFGSEGGLEFVYWDNPSVSALAAFSVGIFGDLRDFGIGEVPQIKEWFEQVTNRKGIWVRNAILEICVEGIEEPIILRFKD